MISIFLLKYFSKKKYFCSISSQSVVLKKNTKVNDDDDKKCVVETNFIKELMGLFLFYHKTHLYRNTHTYLLAEIFKN